MARKIRVGKGQTKGTQAMDDGSKRKNNRRVVSQYDTVHLWTPTSR